MERFTGAITAMVTPFDGSGVNEARLRGMVAYQIEQGISGLVPCGTTGESPTLSHAEHQRVIDIVIETAAGRVPVIAGTGSNSTAEAISLTRHAREAGADAALLITPYYNKPSQAGLIRHYITIAEQCDLPLIAYNCPGRTGVNTTADTIIELANVPNIVGVKEASGSMDQIAEIILRAPEGFSVLSGDDGITLPLIAMGGSGVISVTSNVAPRMMQDMVASALKGDFDAARRLHNRLFPVMRTLMKIETNPSPIKTAMNLMGFEMGVLRLPLVPPDGAGVAQLKKVMTEAGLLT